MDERQAPLDRPVELPAEMPAEVPAVGHPSVRQPANESREGGPRRAIALAVALVLTASLAALALRGVAGAGTSNPPGSVASPAPVSSVPGSISDPIRSNPSTSPSPSPSPSPAPALHALGESVAVGGRETHVAERAERWDRTADPDRIYITVRVHVSATVADVPFDSAYYQLQDGSGTLARPIPNGREPVLAYGRLDNVGDETSGWVTFETGTQGPYRLTYLLPLGANGLLASIVVGFDELSPATPEPTTTPAPTSSADPNPFPPGVPNWGYPTTRSSTYYAGYGATKPGADVSKVSGSWTQPRATCSGSSTTAFSVWVGIDDNGIGNLEQLGTEVSCVAGSKTPHYSAWYEMFPELSRSVPIRAQPGDRFTASVTNEGSRWILAIANRTSGQKWSIARTRQAVAAQALWVAEAPSTQVSEPGQHVLPLTSFGTVAVTGCTAIVGGVRRDIDDPGWAHYRFDMVSRTGTPKASTSALGSGGSAFSVRWRHA